MTPHLLAKYGRVTNDTGAATAEPNDTVEALGASFDWHLNMAAQVNNIIKTCNIRQIGLVLRTSPWRHATWSYGHLSHRDRPIIMSSLFSYHSRPTRLTDYEKCRTARPDWQSKQADRFCNVSQLLCELHWLPVQQRVKFKILLCFQGPAQSGSKVCCRPDPGSHPAARTLRSASAGHLLVVPTPQRAAGCRTFASQAPRLWNELPTVIRRAETKANFKRLLESSSF